MARLKAASTLLGPILSRASALQYQLVQEYNASNIFEQFDFFSGPDPTGGFVQYVSKEVAAGAPLIGNSSDLIYIGVDRSNVYTPGGVGRPSVRLQSKLTFTEGLFVFDLTHIPVGCGTWPALWTTGLTDWPADGEIDIIENVNDARANNAAIHASGDCVVDATTSQTGIWKSTNCSVGHDNNQGCGTILTEPYNYGSEFNANGGGIYAMEWTSDSINIWFFPPTNVPATLLKGGVPDSATFGTPSTTFSGPCSGSFSEKFFNHSIVIDTTFCGGWAGSTFGSGSSSCPLKEGLSPQDSCVDYVANNPEAFTNAYWGIKSIKVWEKVPGFTVPGLATPGVALPTPVATIEPLDVLVKGPVWTNASKPIATVEPLNVSPLTGGVLVAGDDSEDIPSGDDSIGEDSEDILDTAGDLNGVDPLFDAFDTAVPSGIIIAVDIDPVASVAAAVFSGVQEALYGSGNLPIPSASPAVVVPSIGVPFGIPFGVGNTEGHKDLFPPELSLPVPTKVPRFVAPNGNTGIVPPSLQPGALVPQQNPTPSSVVGVQIPNTLPLLLQKPVNDVTQGGVDVPQIANPAITAPEVAAPAPVVPILQTQLNTSTPDVAVPGIAAPVPVDPVSFPLLDASALNAPAIIVPDVSAPGTPELNDPTLNTPTVDTPELNIPPVSVSIPQLGAPLFVPAFDALDVDIPPPASGEDTVFTPPKHSNPFIPAGIGNTGVVPPSIRDGPIVGLWSSFSPELKNKLIAAAANLPALAPGSSPLSDLWNSLSLELKNKVLNAANTLPAVTLENSVPTISDLINAASNGKIASISEIAGPPTLPLAFKPGGLLGFLDAKTKNKLKALFGQASPAGTGSGDRKRQVPPSILPPSIFTSVTAPNNLQPLSGFIGSTAPVELSPPAANNLQPLSGLAQSTTPTTLSQPVAPVLKLAPNVPVTALTSTDTAKAMTGLLSFLDDSTKEHIVDLLFSQDSSTDGSQPSLNAVGRVSRRSDAPWKILPSWNEAKQGLLFDTLYQLDGIIKIIANHYSDVPEVVKNNLFDVLTTHFAEELKETIASIDGDDRLKLIEFFTGDRDVFDDVDTLQAIFLLSDGTATASESQDMMNAAENYVLSPNDDTMNEFMEILQDAASSDYDRTLSDINDSEENTKLTRRLASSIWTPQDKLALAQSIYGLCPVPALAGIPFPSPIDLATDLLNPSMTLEDATMAFERKLQAYFDVTVQSCWAKINQWLAWRQLLRKPGMSTILPYPYPISKPATMRIPVRQKKVAPVTNSDPQGLVEQQIYTICPKQDTFSTDQLIADLKDPNTSIEIAISRFQNRLWAYMAKLQECSDKIRQYGPKLKALSGTPFTEPVFHTTKPIFHTIEPIFHTTEPIFHVTKPVFDATEPVFNTTDPQEIKRHHARHIAPSISRPEYLLYYLVQLKQSGVSYQSLSFSEQKAIYDALFAGTSASWTGNPRTKEELQNLVLQLIKSTQPLGGNYEGSSDQPSADFDIAPISDADTPLSSGDDSGSGASDITLPVDEGGPDGGFDDGINTPPEGGVGGINGIAVGEPNPNTGGESDPAEDTEAGDDDPEFSEPADNPNASLVQGDDQTGAELGHDPFADSFVDDGPSFVVSDDGTDNPTDDGTNNGARVDNSSQDTDINTPAEAPPVEPVPANDTGLAPETPPTADDTQDTTLTADNNENPSFALEPPGLRFRSRILRSLPHLARQDDQNGVIPDAETPADLDAILGPLGSLDPWGVYSHEVAVAPPAAPLPTQDPHDSPTVPDDQLLDLPDTAVDEASPDVDQVLEAGEQDPFHQLQYNKDAGAENAAESWESKEFLGKLRGIEQDEQSARYLGDPNDVADFEEKFLGGREQ